METFQTFSGGLVSSQKQTQGEPGLQQGSQICSTNPRRVCVIAVPGSSSSADGRMKVKDGCRGRVRRTVGEEEEEMWKLWKTEGETGGGLKCECVGMYSTMCSVFIYIWNSRWPIDLNKEWVTHSGTCEWLITAVTCFYPKACMMSPSLWYAAKAACLIGTWAILLHSVSSSLFWLLSLEN